MSSSFTELQVTTDVEQEPWTHLDPVAVGHVSHIGLLRHGTSEGRAAVALVVTTEDGQQIVGQTTWALFDWAYQTLAHSPVIAEELPARLEGL